MNKEKLIIRYFFLLTFAFILCPLSFLLVSCNTTEPPPPVNGNDKPKPKITLTVDDTSPTEVWLNLITENISLPDTLKLLRNNDTVKTIELFYSNYVIYEDSLLPSQSYSYQVTSIEYQVSSEPVNAITMDTTSHNFSWEVFEFGEHGNSILRDVAIIDENNIWAVGAIYLKDSTGANDSKLYNAVHWNGNEWQPLRIVEEGFLLAPEYSIYAIAEDDIWIGGSIPQHWDGNTWTFWGSNKGYEGGFYIYKIWAKSSDEVYLVGGNGNIRYYNGTTWRKIESGTDVDLRDVWGAVDRTVVWACGENNYKTALLKIENEKSEVVFEESYPMPQVKNRFSDGLLSLWTNTNRFIYVLTPYNLYRCNIDTKGEGSELYPYEDYFLGAYIRLRGKAINDLFTVGNKSMISHFNGKSWKKYTEFRNEQNRLTGLSVKGNIIIAVGDKYEGFIDNKGLLIKGEKN